MTVSARRPTGELPAVDHDRLAGDEPSVVGGEERERPGDVLGLPEPPQRQPAAVGLHEPRVVDRLGQGVTMYPGHTAFTRMPWGPSRDQRVVELPDGYWMLSLSDANPTPWNSPHELSAEELAARIEALAEQVPDMSRAIFNLHVPPHGSDIDAAAELDEEFRQRHKGGAPVITAVGSTAVREAIGRRQPLLGLHGHIHESKGIAKIQHRTARRGTRRPPQGHRPTRADDQRLKARARSRP